jgi:hypothetical protein
VFWLGGAIDLGRARVKTVITGGRPVVVKYGAAACWRMDNYRAVHGSALGLSLVGAVIGNLLANVGRELVGNPGVGYLLYAMAGWFVFVLLIASWKPDWAWSTGVTQGAAITSASLAGISFMTAVVPLVAIWAGTSVLAAVLVVLRAMKNSSSESSVQPI